MATQAFARPAAQTFYRRMAIGLSLFIVLGFLQFAARGFVDYGRVPFVFHLHGAAMVSWLALLVVQAGLPSRGAHALHRRLGLSSVALVPIVVVLASATCITALRGGMVPPFFTPAFFLALVHVEVLLFAAMVAWAIAWRTRTDWHRRLMIGSTVILLEPALGRLLPMPLLGAAAPLAQVAVQLGVVAILANYDRRTIKAVHPATLATALVVVASHILIALVAALPAWQALAASIAVRG